MSKSSEINLMSPKKAQSNTRTLPRKKLAHPQTSSTESLVISSRKVVVLALVIFAATFAVYSPVLSHPFLVLDDRDYVTANPHIHGLGWENIKWAFTSTAAANWHPLTWLSHALDYQLFALNPAGHHFSSIFLHAINAVLLFLGLLWLTRRLGPSLFVAALFALHPINVESVAWIAERKNVFSTLFFFLAIGAYAWYAKKPGWRRYLLLVALFAAGLMAKPMLVTLPVRAVAAGLLAAGANELQQSSADESVSSASGAPFTVGAGENPAAALTVASSWMTLGHNARLCKASKSSPSPIECRMRSSPTVFIYGRSVWPAQLAFYPHSLGALPAWQWISSGVFLIAVTVLVISFRRKRYLPVGWFWFLGTLVPVIGLVQVGGYAMADRYAYIPLIGIFLMMAWGACRSCAG